MKFYVLFGAAVLSLATPGLAQDFSFPAPDYVGGWFTTTMPDITMDSPSGVSANDIHGSSGKNRETRATIAAQTVNLQYRVSPQRRATNIDRFVREWAKTDPVGAIKAQPVLTGALPQIDQMMRPMGLRADNVADAYTVWWVIAWHAANGQKGEPDRAVMAAVKIQAENALKSTPEMASATDAQKQEMAEAMLIQAAMIDGHIDDAAGDRTKQAALAKAVNQGAKAMGLDLTKMTLTPNGFVPRSGGRSDTGGVSGDGSQLAATEESGSNLALYAVAGTGLLAGVFALGKGLAKKG